MPSVGKFRESLAASEVDGEVRRRIDEGFEELRDNSPKKVRAQYFKRAMDILDAELDESAERELLVANACCKSGKRQKASKEFAKENAGLSLEEKLKKIPQVPFMGEPVLNADGSITVHAIYYRVDGKFCCACPNYNGVKRDYPVSSSYCFCCAGHFRYHYELMLGIKLRPVEIISSPLNTNGEKPCVMRFETEDENEN